VKKIRTVATDRNEIFKDHKVTIGLDLEDRSSHHCILNEAGQEHSFSTVPNIRGISARTS
jgi:hypothetical protein